MKDNVIKFRNSQCPPFEVVEELQRSEFVGMAAEKWQRCQMGKVVPLIEEWNAVMLFTRLCC